jgi:hypothetical protein
MKRALVAVSSLLALAGCTQVSDPVICTAFVPPSVNVTVQDSVTGANVTPGATLVLREGTYVDSVTAPPVATSRGVGVNRAGTLTLTVTQAGYRAWTKAGVKVEEGPCGARTVDVVARLQPAG